MGSMDNCKFFLEFLYLIKVFGNYTIITYQKGVMAIKLGGEDNIINFKNQDYKKRKKKEKLNKSQINNRGDNIYYTN